MSIAQAATKLLLDSTRRTVDSRLVWNPLKKRPLFRFLKNYSQCVGLRSTIYPHCEIEKGSLMDCSSVLSCSSMFCANNVDNICVVCAGLKRRARVVFLQIRRHDLSNRNL